MSDISIFDRVTDNRNEDFPYPSLPDLSKDIEQLGSLLLAPSRLFLGRSYTAVSGTNGKEYLKTSESFFSWENTAAKIATIALFPLSLISTVLGLGLKFAAQIANPDLKETHQLPIIINARTEENFAGKLPQNYLSPNCVNSQEKSRYGALYDVEPIFPPPHLSAEEALDRFHEIIMEKYPATLIEKNGNYLHYTVTVVIPAPSPVQGTYIDDVDVWYNPEKSAIEIRSASRSGFRDATNFDFSLEGANKKRVETLRKAFNPPAEVPRTPVFVEV